MNITLSQSPKTGFLATRPKYIPELFQMHVLFSFQEPPRFLPNFKNPCFLKNVTLPDFPPLRTIQKLRCLPYFFIVGFPKSGTTDVWFRLINHPDIAGNHEKEPNFFRKGMLGK